ncbi:hypothetical protein ScPMuIL_013177 [Solemya velum]
MGSKKKQRVSFRGFRKALRQAFLSCIPCFMSDTGDTHSVFSFYSGDFSGITDKKDDALCNKKDDMMSMGCDRQKTGFKITKLFGSIARYETRVMPVNDQGWTYLTRNQSATNHSVCVMGKSKTDWWLVEGTRLEVGNAK